MDEDRQWLADRFEEQRGHLRAVAYRMLGSLTEADDAVQDAWLRLSQSRADEVENLGAWLTTVVGRVCLNVLRSRNVRREEPLGVHVPDPVISPERELWPEEEALLADSVGLALLVVLDTLAPAERLAFVLHDMFGLPFEEIAPMVGRTPAAARQLASRARRRVKGADVPAPDPDLARQRRVVDAFFLAARGGDFDALVAVLDPDVVLRIDAGAERPAASMVTEGARPKCGDTDQDIYRIFMTGLDGTPMPSFADNIKPDEAWDLVFYLRTFMQQHSKEREMAKQLNLKPVDPNAPAPSGQQ